MSSSPQVVPSTPDVLVRNEGWVHFLATMLDRERAVGNPLPLLSKRLVRCRVRDPPWQLLGKCSGQRLGKPQGLIPGHDGHDDDGDAQVSTLRLSALMNEWQESQWFSAQLLVYLVRLYAVLQQPSYHPRTP